MLEYLYEQRAKIIIPTIVFSEMLIPLDAIERRKLEARIMKRFQLAPFDVVVAAKHADVWHPSRVKVIFPEYKNDDGESIKHKLRTDSMVVATGLAQNADAIISEDNDFRKLSQGLILVQKMSALKKAAQPKPTSIQGELFKDESDSQL